MAKTREEDLIYKEVAGRPSGLVKQGYWHLVRIGDGQYEMDPLREI